MSIVAAIGSSIGRAIGSAMAGGGEGGGGGGGFDPDFASVVALLHCEGVENGVVFTDEVGNSWAFTTAFTTLTQFKYGASSIAIIGTNRKLTSSSASFFIDTGDDFTFEFWCRNTNTGGARTLFAFGSGIDTGPSLYVYKTYANALFVSFGAASFTGSATVTIGVWHHIAVSRASGTMRLFVDGVQDGSVASNGATSASPTIHIGAMNAVVNSSAMYVDEIRFTNGVARYTTSFTPPTAAFPDA